MEKSKNTILRDPDRLQVREGLVQQVDDGVITSSSGSESELQTVQDESLQGFPQVRCQGSR